MREEGEWGGREHSELVTRVEGIIRLWDLLVPGGGRGGGGENGVVYTKQVQEVVHEVFKPRDYQSNTNPRQSFSKKNELTQAGLKQHLKP